MDRRLLLGKLRHGFNEQRHAFIERQAADEKQDARFVKSEMLPQRPSRWPWVKSFREWKIKLEDSVVGKVGRPDEIVVNKPAMHQPRESAHQTRPRDARPFSRPARCGAGQPCGGEMP